MKFKCNKCGKKREMVGGCKFVFPLIGKYIHPRNGWIKSIEVSNFGLCRKCHKRLEGAILEWWKSEEN